MKKLILSLALIASIAQAGDALTRLQIREQARYRLQDATSTITSQDYAWSNDIINKRINIVQEQIATYTRCLAGQKIYFSSAGIQEYDKPSDCIVVDRVAFSSVAKSTTTYQKLVWESLGSLDRDHGVWEASPPGKPSIYYERANKIGLYPTPSSTYSGTSTIKIDYYKRPAELDGDTDIPFDGDYSLYAYHGLIIDGVVIMCLQDKYYFDGMIQAMKAEYMANLEIMRKEILTRPDRQEHLGPP